MNQWITHSRSSRNIIDLENLTATPNQDVKTLVKESGKTSQQNSQKIEPLNEDLLLEFSNQAIQTNIYFTQRNNYLQSRGKSQKNPFLTDRTPKMTIMKRNNPFTGRITSLGKMKENRKRYQQMAPAIVNSVKEQNFYAMNQIKHDLGRLPQIG